MCMRRSEVSISVFVTRYSLWLNPELLNLNSYLTSLLWASHLPSAAIIDRPPYLPNFIWVLPRVPKSGPHS